MSRPFLAVLVAAVALLAAPGTARAGQCGLPDSTLWIEFGDPAASFAHTVFRRPGLIIATSKPWYAADLRAAGTGTIFWDMHLAKRVGTPGSPADPATIVDAANRLFDFAAAASGCSTPLIALNELNGAQLVPPWSRTNTQYRRNVLTFLETLAARGGRPFLLLPRRPHPSAASWWRQAAAHADLVRQLYIPAPTVARHGQFRGVHYLMGAMRRAVADFTRLGIPARRAGLMLGFHTTPGLAGRNRLQPASEWFEVGKLQAFAASGVASELGLGSVWSWGWGVWSEWEADPDKGAAACVYLWARDPSLCDGVAAAGPGFDATRLDELWLRALCGLPRSLARPC